MLPESIAPSLNDMNYKRRAVYTALQPFFEMKDLMDNLWHWEDHYATAHDVSMRKYVSEICKGEMRAKANPVYHTLMTTLQNKEGELAEDPYALMLAYRSGKLEFTRPKAEKLLVLTDAMVVFNSVLEMFISNLDAEDSHYAFKVREYVASNIGGYGQELDIAQINELLVWMRYMEDRLTYVYSEAQMSRVVHLMYVAACEFFGPTLADRVLSQTIAEVERLPQARKFAPKKIL